MDDNQDKIKKQFTALPKDIRLALASSETAERIKNIGQRNGLNLDQEERLKTEIVITLFAFEHYSNFIENIRRELAIDLAKAQKIGQEINLEIFRPIKQALRIAHGTAEREFAPPLSIAPKPPPIPLPVVPKPPIPPPPTTNLQPTTYNQQPKLAEKEKTPLERTTPGGNYENGENETKLNREEILAGIENPVPTKPTNNIVRDKLEGMVRMPKSETDLSKEYGADPYREPIS